MNELIEKVKNLNDKKRFEKKIEENKLINLKLFEINKDIILYCVNNKLGSRDDFIQLRNKLNYIIKTGKAKYDFKNKLNRLNKLINELN